MQFSHINLVGENTWEIDLTVEKSWEVAKGEKNQKTSSFYLMSAPKNVFFKYFYLTVRLKYDYKMVTNVTVC